MPYSNQLHARRLRPSREIARPALQDPPSRHIIPYAPGRIQPPTVSTRIVTACATFTVEAVPNFLSAVMSWIMAEAWAGCAAYGEAMYPPPPAPAKPVPAARPGLGLISAQVKSGPTGRNALVQTGVIARTVAAPAEWHRAMPPAHPNWRFSLRVAIAANWSRLRQWRERRGAIAELKSLDDRSLRDIGLRRCEIETIMWHGVRRE